MSKKKTHPTVYPSMTRKDNVRAFATLVARAAVKESANPQNQAVVEPDIKQYPVDTETSVNNGNVDLCSRPPKSQPSLFAEDES